MAFRLANLIYIKWDRDIDEVLGFHRRGFNRRHFVTWSEAAFFQNYIQGSSFKTGDEKKGNCFSQILFGLFFGLSLGMDIKNGARGKKPFFPFPNDDRYFNFEINQLHIFLLLTLWRVFPIRRNLEYSRPMKSQSHNTVSDSSKGLSPKKLYH